MKKEKKMVCEICGNNAEFVLGHWICLKHFTDWLDKFCS